MDFLFFESIDILFKKGVGSGLYVGLYWQFSINNWYIDTVTFYLLKLLINLITVPGVSISYM